MRILIPARRGSKGFPGKNIKLFEYTARTIPNSIKDKVTVLTDDPIISEMCEKWNFNCINRPEEVSNDTASTKSLIKWYIDHHTETEEIDLFSPIIILYLTYPERTWKDVELALSLFVEKGVSSLLCKKDIEISPFLILKEEGKIHGSQLFYHNLYRRQDYPKCFEITHYVCILYPKIINKLNDNLYNRDTIYMKIDPKIVDVDFEKDLKRINGIS